MKWRAKGEWFQANENGLIARIHMVPNMESKFEWLIISSMAWDGGDVNTTGSSKSLEQAKKSAEMMAAAIAMNQGDTIQNLPEGATLDTSEQDIKAGDFEQDFVTKSGKIAIIDAALLDGVRNPLVAKAIIVPVLYDDATFTVKGEFDDSIMRALIVKPKLDAEGNVEPTSAPEHDVEVIKPKKTEDDPQESLLSNDPPLVRKVRALNGNKKTKDHLSGKARSNRNRGASKGHKPSPEATVAQAVKRKGHVNKSGQRVRAKRKIPEDVKQIYKFIANTAKEVTVEDIRPIENKPLLNSLVNKMFYMCLSGWSLEEGILKHNLGETADPAVWVVKNGKLYDSASGKRPNISFDWVYNARNAIREFVIEENKNLDVDTIMEGIRNAGRRSITG